MGGDEPAERRQVAPGGDDAVTAGRWWPSKGAVVLDAPVAENVPAGTPAPLPETGDLAADLGVVLRGSIAYLTAPENANLLRAMTAEMQHDAELATRVVDRLLLPQPGAIVERIARERVGGIDAAATAELLVGAVFHRWLLRTGPLDGAHVDRLVRQALPG